VTVRMIPEPPEADVALIARTMRERDRREIFATQWTDTTDELVNNVQRSGPFRWGAYVDDVIPVAMIGAFPVRPMVWQAWAFGTNDWQHVALTLTKHVKGFMIPALEASGVHRVDATALADHEEARRWLTRLGATPGNPLVNFGKNGETFVTYTWLRKPEVASAPATPQTTGQQSVRTASAQP